MDNDDELPVYGLKEFMDEFPTAVQSDLESNNAKIFSGFGEQLVNAQAFIKTINEWRAIDNAHGKALDAIGQEWNEYRAGETDEFYRLKIRSKQAQSRSDGSIDSLIKVICDSLNCDPKEVQLTELYQTTGEPAAVKISNVPFDYANDTKRVQFLIQRLSKSVAGGVRIEGVYFKDKSTSHVYLASFTKVGIHYELKEVV